jgi:hypothetical protein
VPNLSEAQTAQVRKILDSRAFRDTEVLKRLFEYLGRQAIENQGGELKEYTVGVEAFGKPEDYNPQVDSSVRVQAGKLRQRLDAYYREEGTEDDLVIELPKGHFKLEFRPRLATAPPTQTGGYRSWYAAGLLLLFLAGSVFYLARPRHVAPETSWTPEMEEFWRPFLSDRRPVMLAVGTPMFVKVGNDFFRDPALNSWNDTTGPKAREIADIAKAVDGKNIGPSFNYTGVGETQGVFELQRLLLGRVSALELRSSNDLVWEDISRNNMIFLGPPKFIPQTLELPIPQDLQIGHARVHNMRPAPGEPISYPEKFSADGTNLEEGHALISRLPGLHNSGTMLILAASSTEGTRAAVEFVTRPEYVNSFVRQMHSRGGIPQRFQMVIHARYKSKTPISIELVAIHPLK